MRPAAIVLLALGLLLHARPSAAQYGLPASAGLNLGGPAGEYLSVANKTDIQGNPAYTLEAWVYPLTYSNYPTIIGNDYQNSFWLGLNTSGNVRFYPTGGSYVETAAVVPLNEWTHVAATYEQGVGWSIFLNGKLASTGFGIVGAVGTTTEDLRIGADRNFGVLDYLWQGYLDEVRIWSEARTGPQIESTMYVEVGNPFFQTPAYFYTLEAVWDMHLTAVTGAYDRDSGLGAADNFAQFEPGPILSNAFAAPVSPNVAVEFNGIDDYAVIPMGDGFSQGLSIEAWVAPRSYSGYPAIVGRDYMTSFWFGLNTSGKLRFYPTGGAGNYVQSTTTIPLDRWTHVAATYRNGITTLYVNGRLDSQTGTITGPVGENGHFVDVGQDLDGSYRWNGYLDEVRVTRGELSPQQIRQGMFLGYSGFLNPLNVSVTGGMAERWSAHFDGLEQIGVFGSDARLVKSGAALSAPGWAPGTAPASEFDYRIIGGSTLPDGAGASYVSDDIFYPANLVVGDVDVFVFAPTTDLSQVEVTLRSPAMLLVDLVAPGAARGRDLHTEFNDDAVNTLASGIIPYTQGVKPSQSLSTFNGQSAQGLWRLELFAAGTTRLDLWAWGLRFNGLPVGVDGSAVPLAADLRLTGAHPVRGTGGLVFDLPREAQVDLALIDVQGRAVRTLFSGRSPAGTTSLQWRTAGLAPGVYFAVLRLDGAIEKRRRVVVIE